MKTIQPTLINYSMFKTLDLFNSNVTIGRTGIVHTTPEKCSNCGTTSVLNGNSNNGNHPFSRSSGSFLKRGQQYCSTCNKTLQIENPWLDKNLKLIDDYLRTQVLSLAYNLSEDDIVVHIKKTNGIEVSKGTVHNIITSSEEELTNIDLAYKFSDGFYCYDEQYLKIDGKRAYRIVIFDAKEDNVVYEKIHYKFSKKILQEILRKVFGDNSPKGFVVDMKIEYPKAFKAVFGRNIKLQFCVFHLNKLILKEYKESLKLGSHVKWNLMHYYNLYRLFDIFYDRTYELTKIKSFMDNHKAFVDKLTAEKVKIWVKKYKIDAKKFETQKRKVIEICERKLMKAFRKLRHSKKNFRRRNKKTLIVRSSESARKKLDCLLQEKDYFPKKVSERLKKIDKNFQYFIASGGEILTNNKLEGFFGSTLKKFRKKLKRTIQGISAVLKRKRLDKANISYYKNFLIPEVARVFTLVCFFV